MKDFSQIISYENIKIGYIPGSTEVLFIKTGQGGSIYGYNNKYIDFAHAVNERCGFSVFVSATDSDAREMYDLEMELVNKVFQDKSYLIYYLGVSKGGLIGCWYGADNPKLKKIMSVNAPLMLNYHGKTLPAIKKLGRDKLVMVYGSLDPSHSYVPFAEKYANVKVVSGADHNFRGMTEAFYEIVTRDLLNK